MNETIIYEQPLNEVIRVCLRLEQLFQQIDHELNDSSILGTRNVIACIIQVLHILDRPDLKAKLAKELSQLQSNLARYGNAPDIDAGKLTSLTHQLDELSRGLIDSSGKIGQRLREIELLNVLRLQLASPGGGCSFDLPLYHYWLQQPSETRQAVIQDWLSEFKQIKAATTLALEMVRNNARIEHKVSVHGFYQELLDPQSNLRMIRIGLEPSVAAYPEISIGRHFLGVRFYHPDILKRPTQCPDNIAFQIAYCHI